MTKQPASSPGSQSPALLSVQDLRVYFKLDQGTVKAVDGIEFEVEEVFSYGITVLHARKPALPATKK